MEEHHTSAQANPASTREDKDNWESSHGTKEGQTEVENSIIIGAEKKENKFPQMEEGQTSSSLASPSLTELY